MGGPVAQLLWRRHPELVSGLVLCATSYRFVAGTRERLIFSSAMATAVGTTRAGDWVDPHARPRGARRSRAPRPARPTNLRAWAAGEMRRHDMVKVMEAGQAIGSYNARRWIGEVDVPTTVLVTTDDRAIVAGASSSSWPRRSPAPRCSCSTTATWPAPSGSSAPRSVRAVDSVAARRAPPALAA